ncbi:hypothetical protein ENSA7_69070 [Enhygromyxa salina]|uniref:Uncharacterized protein n=1 Tax=Enhygromyxa salina TaxID=215803 RepID=A0A2S9XTC0_9BACT|nr:hypothetical protein ENSA7_69070 [Enhygromyxa salina]
MVEQHVKPTIGEEDTHVRVVLRIPEDDAESF